MRHVSSCVVRLALCTVLFWLCLAPSVSAVEDPDIPHYVNGWVYYEDPSVDFEAIVGSTGPDYRTIVDEDTFTFDEQGRVTSMEVFEEHVDSGEIRSLGRFPVTYQGNQVFLNGQYIGTYGLEGATSSENATKSSSEVTSEEVTRQASRTTKRLIGKRVATMLAPRPKSSNLSQVSELGYELAPAAGEPAGHKGLAAGEQPRRWGLWGNAAMSKLDNYSDDANYSGWLGATLFGADYKPTEELLLGLALGYEHNYLDTRFNDGELRSDGFTVSPYFGYSILESLVWDVSGAVTFLQNESKRAMSSLDFDADYSSLRTMVSTNLNYYHLLGNWTLNANSGFMYSNEFTEEFVERGMLGFRNTVSADNAYVGEFNFGGRVGYFFDQVEPYLALSYLWDPWMSGGDSLDRDEVEASLGLNIAPSRDFLVTLELTHSFLREHVQSTTMMCSLRYEF